MSRSKKQKTQQQRPSAPKKPPWDTGAEGKANQLRLVEEPRGEATVDLNSTARSGTQAKITNPNGVVGYRRKSIVEILFSKKKLTARQWALAIELRDAHEARKAQDPLAALSIDQGNSCGDRQAAMVDRRQKFLEMWAKVPRGAKPVLEHVVLDDKPMRALQGKYARALARLRFGLDALAC